MGLAERREGQGKKQALRAVKEELVRRKVVYALVCEKENDKLVKGSKWRSEGERRKYGTGRAAL